MIRSGEWEVMNARLPARADLVLYGHGARPALVLEVKTVPPREQRDPKAWAMRVHRNLLIHSAIPASPYFVLAAFPERGYLWRHIGSNGAEAAPDFEFDLIAEFPSLSSSPANGSIHTRSHDLEAFVAQAFRKALEDPDAQVLHPWMEASGLLAELGQSDIRQSIAAKKRRAPGSRATIRQFRAMH